MAFLFNSHKTNISIGQLKLSNVIIYDLLWIQESYIDLLSYKISAIPGLYRYDFN